MITFSHRSATFGNLTESGGRWKETFHVAVLRAQTFP